MDAETNEKITGLFYDRKVLQGLVDVILDSVELGYKDRPTVNDDEAIITYLKVFYPDELNNRVDALLQAREEARDNG